MGVRRRRKRHIRDGSRLVGLQDVAVMHAAHLLGAVVVRHPQGHHWVEEGVGAEEVLEDVAVEAPQPGLAWPLLCGAVPLHRPYVHLQLIMVGFPDKISVFLQRSNVCLSLCSKFLLRLALLVRHSYVYFLVKFWIVIFRV